MDPIEYIHVEKDTSLGLMVAAQKRGFNIFYMQQHDLFIENGLARAYMTEISVSYDPNNYFEKHQSATRDLHELDVILMRKDPPFDMEYIYTTYLLELAERSGTLVLNKPQSLRDANEKVFTTLFPQCSPEHLISRNMLLLRDFIKQHHDVVFKPLHSMGGDEIFLVDEGNPNTDVILEMLTVKGKKTIMAQKFIPAIKNGDKRIFIINGKTYPYALTRIPKQGDFRGNLAAGASAKVEKINKRDQWICDQLAPTLVEKGLLFVGIDVIGDYLSEINVTSPTCIREIEREVGESISEIFIECILRSLAKIT